jgi:hypothetical protein
MATQKVTARLTPAVAEGWEQTATGLLPGRKLEGTAVYVPDDDLETVGVGFTEQAVLGPGSRFGPEGSIRFWMDVETLTTSATTNGPLPRPGTIYGWIHEPTLRLDDPPIMLANGVPAFSATRVES